MDDNDFVMDALFAEVKQLNADLQEEDANAVTERDETMESKEEHLLKAIFSENEDPDDNYPETYAEKAGYAEYALTHTLQDISAALWRLSRLDRLLFAAEKDGETRCRKLSQTAKSAWRCSRYCALKMTLAK